jgi:hypothetical protein
MKIERKGKGFLTVSRILFVFHNSTTYYIISIIKIERKGEGFLTVSRILFVFYYNENIVIH